MARLAAAPGPGRHPAVAVRPRLRTELLLLLICYGAYEVVRNLVPTDHAMAAHRAYLILDLEYAVNLDVEYALNRLFAEHTWIAIPANYFYATMHFVVTIGVMLWLYVRHPGRYPLYRSLLFATTLIGLVGFWLFPLAPPRMLPGFTDTVISFGTWGIYDSGPTAEVSNQYAAMPSMHMAWALWSTTAIITIVRRRWVVALAVSYPALTVVIIMGTANHYILDAVGGAVALALGYALALGAFRASTLALLSRGHPLI
ncbi:phosphatase PAP2 family protein [Actinomadura rudentiformis]|uniref:Phosphatase PAP2 family protein n=1 Tax=Actinomadura rudentiformis TaxID=359158 RepID=A0A6H9YLC4_9ACTN|nr:phosphatase PAP2 family protein [Actinomadura rudentiformis]KAB2345468.1 phosphatase PAP2 family protein [Actinomadura rudentiformis]